MFDNVEITPDELLLYIAELYIRNMQNLKKISLLKEQIEYFTKRNEEVDNLRKRSDDLQLKCNQQEALIIELESHIKDYEKTITELQSKIENLEAELARYQNKKRSKK